MQMLKNIGLVILFCMFLDPGFKMTSCFDISDRTTGNTRKL